MAAILAGTAFDPSGAEDLLYVFRTAGLVPTRTQRLLLEQLVPQVIPADAALGRGVGRSRGLVRTLARGGYSVARGGHPVGLRVGRGGFFLHTPRRALDQVPAGDGSFALAPTGRDCWG